MNLFEKDLNNGKKFHDKLFHRAYYAGIKIIDIEDLIQDYYISTSNSIKNFREEITECADLSNDKALGPYLGAGFNYRIRTFIREKARTNLSFFSEVEKEDYQILQQCGHDKRQELPKERAIKKELIEKMMTAFPKLRERDRTILSLFYFSGFKYREISKQLDIPMGTVPTRLTVAKKRLRKLASLVN